MSVFNIRPFGPEPLIKLKSISLCFAILFAKGEANILVSFFLKFSMLIFVSKSILLVLFELKFNFSLLSIFSVS